MFWLNNKEKEGTVAEEKVDERKNNNEEILVETLVIKKLETAKDDERVSFDHWLVCWMIKRNKRK